MRGCRHRSGLASPAITHGAYSRLSVATRRADVRCLRAGNMGAGMTTSFFASRALVQETGIQTARALDTRLPLAEQLVALHTLQGELERLQYRIREGAPWYQRFGLERNQQLLAAAFHGYAQAANRLVRDVAVDHLQQQLNAFVALPPNSPQRTATGEQRYKQLKALLMTSRPEKADAAFSVPR